MPEKARSSRREFFARSAQTAALFGIGGVSARAATASSIPSYRPALTCPAGGGEVRGLAVGPDDDIYIAADREVRILRADGTIGEIHPLTAQPTCVAVRGNGDLLVGFKAHIELIGADGGCREQWGNLESGSALTNLAVAGDGSVYAADGGKRVLWHFDAEGNVLGEIRREDGEFSVPRDFFPVVLRDDDIVVANLGRHRIETYSAEGKMVAAWGGRSRSLEGFGGCCNPISLAVTPDGRYVTAEGGLPRIKLFDAEGNLQELIAGPDEFEANARGSHENTPDVSATCHAGGLEVAVDSKGRVIVLDRVTAEVRVFAQG